MAARKRRGVVTVGGAEPAKEAFIRDLPPVKTLALDTIQPRGWGDTRPLDPGHVVALAESIAALGLLEPLVLDRDKRLLAGGHRLAALRVLAVSQDERAAALLRVFNNRADEVAPEHMERVGELKDVDVDPGAVPVRFVDFSSMEDADRALAIEASENEQRRDYTKAEVKEIYETLLARGFTDRRGKPARGEKPARPMIAAIIGKSLRHVRRLLAPEPVLNRTQVRFSDPPSTPTPTREPSPSRSAEQLSLDTHTEPPVEEVPYKAQDPAPELRALADAARAYLTQHRETGPSVYVTAALEIVAAYGRKR